MQAMAEVVPWFEGTLTEEPSAGILLVDLVQLVVPLDFAPPVEKPLHDVLTAGAVEAVQFLSEEVLAETPLIERPL